MKRAATQHMNMQVENALPGADTAVNDGAIAIRFQTSATCKLCRHEMKMSKQ